MDNIVSAIQTLLQFGMTELHRRDCGTLVAGCASPSIAQARDTDGTERRICARLKVPRGCRCAKSDFRPYMYRSGALRRQSFEVKRTSIAKGAPNEGDMVYVMTCNSEGKLLEVGEDGSCRIEFSMGDISEVREYLTMGLTKETRNKPGSARLRHILPPLSPPARKTISTSGALNGLALRIDEHVRSRCSESPHTRDSMSRRVAPFLHERKQALIKTEPIEEMFADFKKQCAEGQGCKLTTYKNYMPWNLKGAYRETCLCAQCESQRLHMEGLRVAADLLMPVVAAAEQARDAAEEEAALQRQEMRREAAEQAARAAAEACRPCEPDVSERIGGAAADAAELDVADGETADSMAAEESGEGGDAGMGDARSYEGTPAPPPLRRQISM